mmetsp:Transcript_22849/g.71198  ORF Transcript_22849/g.71198 Transcript_22849/m.71198 type:complete len:308 (+) Transcript_22849:131-1054(+)
MLDLRGPAAALAGSRPGTCDPGPPGLGSARTRRRRALTACFWQRLRQRPGEVHPPRAHIHLPAAQPCGQVDCQHPLLPAGRRQDHGEAHAQEGLLARPGKIHAPRARLADECLQARLDAAPFAKSFGQQYEDHRLAHVADPTPFHVYHYDKQVHSDLCAFRLRRADERDEDHGAPPADESLQYRPDASYLADVPGQRDEDHRRAHVADPHPFHVDHYGKHVDYDLSAFGLRGAERDATPTRPNSSTTSSATASFQRGEYHRLAHAADPCCPRFDDHHGVQPYAIGSRVGYYNQVGRWVCAVVNGLRR